MKHTIRLLVILAIVTVVAGCADKAMPTGPDAAPNFTGNWIGGSRVLSCDNSAGGCENYPVGRTRFLSFHLTQSGDEVTGNLTPVRGGPLMLPPVFWISGRLASGSLSFEPMDVPGASGGLTSFSGELTLTASSPPEMRGRMTERSTHPLGPRTIVWAVSTSRQPLSSLTISLMSRRRG